MQITSVAPIEIRTARVLLRPWRAEDAADLLPVLEANRDHLGPWIPARVATPAPVPILAERLAGFAADFSADREWRFGMFSIQDGRLLGEVALFPRSPTGRVPFVDADRVEMGYWLRADETGRGLVTEAARAVLTLASHFPRFSRAEIRCDVRNGASAAIPPRLGFTLLSTVVDGENREMQVWVSKLSQDPSGPHSANAPDLSRREFLAASAIGLAGLSRGFTNLPASEEKQLNGDLLYVGTYTEAGRHDGIHLIRMDSRSGKLTLVASVDAGENPSFLAVHPNGRVLYAVNEVDKYNGKASGAVSAFAIARDTGALTRLDEQPSGGASPCYVSVDRSGRVALVANYYGGNLALLPIQADGSLAPATQLVQHTGSGPNAERQDTAHAHCVIADPTNRFVLSADLGADRIFVYRLDVEGKSLSHVEGGDAVMRSGAGPRHIAFHPTVPLVFVTNELDSTVATLRFDAKRGILSQLDTYSTLPAGWSGTNHPADIHVAPSGRTLYVSNRGHDSIAVFSVAESTGALALEQVISTGGDWPRNFTLDPSGRWLLVANQKSNSIIVFARDKESGRLTTTPQRITMQSPVCLRFSAHVRVTA